MQLKEINISLRLLLALAIQIYTYIYARLYIGFRRRQRRNFPRMQFHFKLCMQSARD